MRPLIFSSAVCKIEYAAAIARDRDTDVWKVATIGASAAHVASRLKLGAAGSCTWTTSNPPSRNHRRTRPSDNTPNANRATDPL